MPKVESLMNIDETLGQISIHINLKKKPEEFLPGTFQKLSSLPLEQTPPNGNTSIQVLEVGKYLTTFNRPVFLFLFFLDNLIFQISFLSGLTLYNIKMNHGPFLLKKGVSFLIIIIIITKINLSIGLLYTFNFLKLILMLEKALNL